jgi:hypothetical protein
LSFVADGSFTLGMLGCIASIVFLTFEFSVSQTGITVQWGNPLVAIAIKLAAMVFLTQFLGLFAPDEDSANAEAGLCCEGTLASMKAITSRAPVLMLALIAMQVGSSGSSELGFLGSALAALSAPFKLGLIPVAVAMKLQIVLLLAYVSFHCDESTTPTPPLDATGTLAWEPKSEMGQNCMTRLRSVVLLLLQGGLITGMLGMGVLPWIPIKLVLILIVFPCLPQTGKSNIMEGFGIAGLALQSCGGVIGEKVEAVLAKKRAAAEAAAAKKAAEIVETEGEGEEQGEAKKSRGEPMQSDFKKAPKKTAGAKAKKKGGK